MSRFSESGRRPDLLIFTPMLVGSGGCAVYYTILTRALSARGLRVAVASEFLGPGVHPSHVSEYIGLLTPRSSRDLSLARNLPRYAVNNAQTIGLEWITRRLRPRVALIHTSFLNNRGVFRALLPHYARTCRSIGTRLIADVRDNLLPAQKITLLGHFDEIICCSLNATNRIQAAIGDTVPVHHIPVVHDPPPPDEDAAQSMLTQRAVAERYLLYVGALKDSKGVGEVLSAFDQLATKELRGFDLVLVGLRKDMGRASLRALDDSRVKVIGPVPHSVVLGLMRRARCCVNISPSEGLPRASLEALDTNGCVVLPPGIPEFLSHAPAAVCDPPTAAQLTSHLKRLADLGWPRASSYPLGSHSGDAIIPRYMEVLFPGLPRDREGTGDRQGLSALPD